MFKPKLDVQLMPFAAFFATIPLYSPNIASFTRALGQTSAELGCFVKPLLLCSFVMGLALAVASLNHAIDRMLKRRRVVIGSSVLYLSGFAVMAVDGATDVNLAFAEACAGALCGAGLMTLCCSWGARFSRLDIRTGLLNVSLACGIGSLVAFALSSLSGAIYLVLFFAIALTGVATLVLDACASSPHGKRPAADEGKGEGQGETPGNTATGSAPDANDGDSDLARALSPRQPGETVFDTLKRLASVAAAPFIGFIVFAFTMSVRKFSVLGSYDIELVAGIAAPLIVLPLCFTKTKSPFFSFSHQQFLPTCSLGLIVLNSFPVGTSVQIAGAAVTYGFFSVVGVIALASLCAVVHAREFPATLVFGSMIAAFSLVSFVGIEVSKIAPDDMIGPALMVLSTLYFAGIILSSIVALSAQAEQPAPAHDRNPSMEEALGIRCRAVAERSALSPREAEILSYLGRGHNPTFIARTLVLSISTVRTHVRNIYRKAGVSSHEELLALIDSQE